MDLSKLMDRFRRNLRLQIPAIKFVILGNKVKHSEDETLQIISLMQYYLVRELNDEERDAAMSKYLAQLDSSRRPIYNKLQEMNHAELGIMYLFYEARLVELRRHIYRVANIVFRLSLSNDTLNVRLAERLAEIIFDYDQTKGLFMSIPEILSKKLIVASSETDRDRYVAGILSTVYERLSDVDKLKVKVVLHLKENHPRESIHASSIHDLSDALKKEGREYLWSIRREGLPSDFQIKEVFKKPKRGRGASQIDVEHHITGENTVDSNE